MEMLLAIIGMVALMALFVMKRLHDKSSDTLLHKLHNHNETIRVMTEEIKSLKSSFISLKLSLTPKPLPTPPPKEPEDPEIIGALIDSIGNMREYEIIPTMPEKPQLEAAPKRRKTVRHKKKSTRK